jgi:hypothetical protein
MGLGVELGVGSTLLDFGEAMMGRLITDLDTFADRFDVPVVLVSFLIGTRGAATKGNQPGRSSTQDPQQFSAIHDFSPLIEGTR